MAGWRIMRQLLILRHAKSSWDDASLPDRDRPLNKRGRHAAAIMRRAMQAHGLSPDLVLVSAAKRTMQTLEALEPWDETPLIEPMESLYLATSDQYLAALQAVPETVRSVLLIGHNPGLHDLALLLMAPRPPGEAAQAAHRLGAGFPTAALAEMTVSTPWSELAPGGARLVRFLTPRALDPAD
jgi:phosphohistidine phosphatase